MDNLLSMTIFIPAIAASILWVFLRGDDAEAQGNAKWVGFIATTITFIVSLFIAFEFDAGDPGFQFVEEHAWPFGLTYKVGVDGVSLGLVMLTTFLMPLIIAGSWLLSEQTKGFVIALLVLETALLGAFLSLDLLFFFVFAEGALIPFLVILSVWGGENGPLNAVKLAVYALPGAFLILLAMVLMAFDAQTTDVEALMSHQFNADPVTLLGIEVAGGAQFVMALALLLGFLAKIPLWPLHAWVPGTYARLPIGASMVMSALLVKIGAYGMLRFVLTMFPDASVVLAPFVIWLSVATLLYAAIAAMAQDNIVRLLSYIGTAHIAVATLAIFSLNQQGMDGAIFLMVSHGLVMAALLLSAGVLYDRVESTDIKAFGGLAMRMPGFAFVTMILILASLAVPGTSGFAGLFLSVVGLLQASAMATVLALLGLVISAAVLLSLYKRVVFGPLIKQSLKTLDDLDRRETAVFTVLLGMIICLGLFPGLVTDQTGAVTASILSSFETALAQIGASE